MKKTIKKIKTAGKRFFQRFVSSESGQATVLFIIALTTVLSCAALAVDLGSDYVTTQKLQNAADLAALAAAKKLPNSQNAIDTGYEYAMINGAPEYGIVVTTPYEGDSCLVEVSCTKENAHGFAKVFGSDSAEFTRRSIAKVIPPKWAGAALPLLNVEEYDIGSGITIWEKNSPGNFGVLFRKKMTWVPGNGGTPGHFIIEYQDGVYVENGKIGSLKDEIEEMCAPGRTVFLFSLTNDAIDAGGIPLGQAVMVPPEQLILLQCTVTTYTFHSIAVTVTAEYDIFGNYGEPNIPDDFVFNADGASSVLVG